jgi:Prion-inhibition and propagation
MEPVGLTVGVIALAGLFNNAVDSFEYIQLGWNTVISQPMQCNMQGNTTSWVCISHHPN